MGPINIPFWKNKLGGVGTSYSKLVRMNYLSIEWHGRTLISRLRQQQESQNSPNGPQNSKQPVEPAPACSRNQVTDGDQEDRIDGVLRTPINWEEQATFVEKRYVRND